LEGGFKHVGVTCHVGKLREFILAHCSICFQVLGWLP
jgi:hypothetical protein